MGTLRNARKVESPRREREPSRSIKYESEDSRAKIPARDPWRETRALSNSRALARWKFTYGAVLCHSERGECSHPRKEAREEIAHCPR